MAREVWIWNQSSLVTDDQVQTAVAAIQRQVVEHFIHYWDGGILHFIPRNELPAEGTDVIKVVDTCDDPGALGYHTVEGKTGEPAGIVGVKTSMDDGVSWTSCLSHEVLELLADPECVRCFQCGDHVVALEVCDACEGFTYNVDGVEVSDFCTPDYFTGGPGPYSQTGHLDGPWPTLGQNGYSSAAVVGEWRQENADKVRASKRSAGKGSRRAKRVAA